jgi:hypothetical protein
MVDEVGYALDVTEMPTIVREWVDDIPLVVDHLLRRDLPSLIDHVLFLFVSRHTTATAPHSLSR